MLQVISGSPRCGKSTLLRRIVAQGGHHALELDALTAGIEAWGGADIPPLPDFQHTSDEEWIHLIRRRDSAIWPGLLRWIHRHFEVSPGSHLTLAGAIWPDHLSAVEVPHQAVFVVDTSPEQFRRLRAITGLHNWQQSWSDERLHSWARKNVLRSRTYSELARSHGYAVVDLADHRDPRGHADYEAVQERARHALCQDCQPIPDSRGTQPAGV